MIRNWKITANLISPLCGDPPKFDALLMTELAFRMGLMAHALTRNKPLENITIPPIPICKQVLAEYPNKYVFCCSDPIFIVNHESVEHHTKRFDCVGLSEALHPSQHKSLLTSSGPYKSRRVPERIRHVDKIVWFARCDRREVNKLLKRIMSIGKDRSMGYGIVGSWDFDDMEDRDYSMFAYNSDGQKILMRTLPACSELNGCIGYMRTYGGAFPPYWHPDNYMEIAIPC